MRQSVQAQPLRKNNARRSKANTTVGPFSTPIESANAAELHYINDGDAGISRKAAGAAFSYRDTNGKVVRDAATLARIKSLAIPPAWTDVWISADPIGHLQATGRDARGRKQYRYHPLWTSVRDETKYGRSIQFGEALGAIRRRVNDDLASNGLTRERVLATIVRLLELTFIRVGNTEYARSNKSFGLTTLLDRHVQIAGTSIVFKFRGKSGVSHDIRLTDKRLAALVKRCRDVPGQELFQYYSADGTHHRVHSNDVNEYLRSVAQNEFTAKDFRTWAGTLLAAGALFEAHISGENVTKSKALGAVKAVAAQLGNTPAVSRKCYIHPAILKSFEDEKLRALFVKESSSRKKGESGLTREESALLRFLKHKEVKAVA
ncbi:MAG: DNA topoisomerase IB [Gemmatimonadaceae bacterium]